MLLPNRELSVMNEWPMDELKRVGERIFELRKAKGWSRTNFASEIGCEYSQAQKLERGESLQCLRWIYKIAKAFEIDPGALISDRSAEVLSGEADALDESVLIRSIAVTLKLARDEDLEFTDEELGETIANSYRILLRNTRKRGE